MKPYLCFSILPWYSSRGRVLTFYFIAVGGNWQDAYFMLLLSWFSVHHSLVFLWDLMFFTAGLLGYDTASWGMWMHVIPGVTLKHRESFAQQRGTHLKRRGSSYICLIFRSLSLCHQSPSSCNLAQRFSLLTCGNSCFRYVVLWTVFCTNFVTVKCFLLV